MKRRTTALLLAAALALTLCGASVLAAEESPEVTEDQVSQDIVNPQEPQAAQPDGSQAAEAAPTETEPSAEDPEEDAEAPQKEPAPSPDAAGTLSFANLDSRVRANNLNYLILEESIAGIEVIDYEELREDLRDQLNMLADYQLLLKLSGDSYAASSLKSNYDSLRETFEDLKDGKLQQDSADGVRQLRNAQNSIIMTLEGVYAQLVELDATGATLDRSLAALDRQIEELELRYELGQVSALTVQQAKAGRTSLVSSRQSLATGMKSGRMNLEAMIGEELTGTLKLGALPTVTAKELDAMDLEADLTAAKEASYDLYAARKTLDDAKETFEDAKDQYNDRDYQYAQAQHDWQAAQYTYENSMLNFELSFRTLYDQVKDYKQVLDAAQTALAVEESNYQVDQLKYEQGTISKNALLTAQDDVAAAQDTVDSAKRDLFVAYNNYRWAVDYGILN